VRREDPITGLVIGPLRGATGYCEIIGLKTDATLSDAANAEGSPIIFYLKLWDAPPWARPGAPYRAFFLSRSRLR